MRKNNLSIAFSYIDIFEYLHEALEGRKKVMLRKLILECSSIYAIDFAEVVFSALDNREYDYILYLNNIADTNSEFRQYISRLSIPTMNWEVDAHGCLRQIHLSIENINKDQFLHNLNQATTSYLKYFSDNSCQIEFLHNLKKDIEKECSDDGMDCYKKLIQQIIAVVCNKRITIKDFGAFRAGSSSHLQRLFLSHLKEDIIGLPDGNYNFVKGASCKI